MRFRAVFESSSCRNVVSAKGLQRILAFGSYETAWTWPHKLRVERCGWTGRRLRWVNSGERCFRLHIHALRGVQIGLLAIDDGDVRLTLLQMLSRHAHGTNLGLMCTSGAMLLKGYPKRSFQLIIILVTFAAIEESSVCQRPGQGADAGDAGGRRCRPWDGRGTSGCRNATGVATVATARRWRVWQRSAQPKCGVPEFI
jgi:hypothetical protein